MIAIRNLIKNIETVSLTGAENPVIENIEFDSRKVKPGTLFVAVRGTKNDGHEFIESAVASGASAVICEILPEKPDGKVCWIKTTDSAQALGIASSEFFGNPSASLKLTGVTGTNGKTTVATLLYRMFTRLGYKCGLFSTVCNYIVTKSILELTQLPIRFSLTGAWQKWSLQAVILLSWR